VNVPCIALIEDIDNVFHGRENVVRTPGLMPLLMPAKPKEGEDDKARGPFTPLTFDTLLNCLDGVERADGVFTIITTNDIAKVDPALGQPRRLPDGTVEFISTRPGRIDKAVELTWMEPDDKKTMSARILADYPHEHAKMLAFIEQYPDLKETPAQFQERCGQVALAAFWRDKTQGTIELEAAESIEVPALGLAVGGVAEVSLCETTGTVRAAEEATLCPCRIPRRRFSESAGVEPGTAPVGM
jgi:SpoVK/Ycf46/Vps4 family AAA+-type ATPase